MDEQEFRAKLDQLAVEYANYLELYENNDSWTENRITSFKNRTGGLWDRKAAAEEYRIIKRTLEEQRKRATGA